MKQMELLSLFPQNSRLEIAQILPVHLFVRIDLGNQQEQ